MEGFYFQTLRILDANVFWNYSDVTKIIKKIKEKRTKSLNIQANKAKKIKDIIDQLDSIASTPLTDFSLDEITIEQDINNCPLDFLLLFDNIKATFRVPFIHVKVGKYKYTKIFDHISLPSEWIENIDKMESQNGIFMYVQKNKYKLDPSNYEKINRSYSFVTFYIIEDTIKIK